MDITHFVEGIADIAVLAGIELVDKLDTPLLVGVVVDIVAVGCYWKSWEDYR